MEETLVQLQTDDDEETLIPDFTSQDNIHIILLAISSFYVSVSIQGMSKTAGLNIKDITLFLALVQFFAISHQFLDTSHFSCGADDLLALTIVNILHLPITSTPDMPLVCILATTSSLM